MRKCYVFSCLLPTVAVAQFPPEPTQRVAEPKLPLQGVSFAEKSAKSALWSMSETEQALLADSELARQVINRAIDAGQWHLLPKLSEIYRQSANADPILLQYAEGLGEYSQGSYAKAIRQFEQILQANPQFHPVRLRFAQALFDDFQHNRAKQAFAELAASQPPAQIAQLIHNYQQALAEREKWQINLGVNYLRENNVNNASRAEYIYIANVPFKKNAESLPQKAQGVNYALSLAKKVNIGKNHYMAFENQLAGKVFWDNHPFDDHTNRTSLGYQFQNVTYRAAVLPFYEQRWAGNRRYNQGVGVRLESDKWLSRHWQLALASEQNWLKHRGDNRQLDSRLWLGSATLLYVFDSKSYLFGGGDYMRNKTQERSFASIKRSVRFGVGHQWENLGGRIQVSYSKRQFDAPHKLLQKVRLDKEFGVNVSVWHKKFSIWGITPKLVYSYNRIQSNLDSLYSSDKQRIYFDFSKSF